MTTHHPNNIPEASGRAQPGNTCCSSRSSAQQPASAQNSATNCQAKHGPETVFVEVTTRCNMQCGMCVKQTADCAIPDEDLPFDTFTRITPVLGGTSLLILNGIGEPLLHPQLERMIQHARAHMPEQACIGFQTNGLLLTRERIDRLIEAGLNTICISIDTLEDTPAHDLHESIHSSRIEQALSMLRERAQCYPKLQFTAGAEFVLLRDNMHQLPDVVRWAGTHGLDYLIVTHAMAYKPELESQTLFSYDSAAARQLVQKWERTANAEGLSLQDYSGSFWKFAKTPSQKRLLVIVEAMQQEAAEAGISLNLKRLLTKLPSHPDHAQCAENLTALFAKAAALAQEGGIKLHLPALEAHPEGSCPFIDTPSMFVSANGSVYGCYFLWHQYACALDGQQKLVTPRPFGSIQHASPLTIWRSQAFRAFRHEAEAAAYADCFSCQVGPCDDVTGALGPFDIDCHGAEVPCGHCPWRLGALQCLQHHPVTPK